MIKRISAVPPLKLLSKPNTSSDVLRTITSPEDLSYTRRIIRSGKEFFVVKDPSSGQNAYVPFEEGIKGLWIKYELRTKLISSFYYRILDSNKKDLPFSSFVEKIDRDAPIPSNRQKIDIEFKDTSNSETVHLHTFSYDPKEIKIVMRNMSIEEQFDYNSNHVSPLDGFLEIFRADQEIVYIPNVARIMPARPRKHSKLVIYIALVLVVAVMILMDLKGWMVFSSIVFFIAVIITLAIASTLTFITKKLSAIFSYIAKRL